MAGDHCWVPRAVGVTGRLSRTPNQNPVGQPKQAHETHRSGRSGLGPKSGDSRLWAPRISSSRAQAGDTWVCLISSRGSVKVLRSYIIFIKGHLSFSMNGFQDSCLCAFFSSAAAHPVRGPSEQVEFPKLDTQSPTLEQHQSVRIRPIFIPSLLHPHPRHPLPLFCSSSSPASLEAPNKHHKGSS